MPLTWLSGLFPLRLPTLLTACGPSPAPKAPVPDPSDCLDAVAIGQLQQAIARCDQVVAAHPFDPQPRNDRALLLSLAHRQRAACQDMARAAALLAQGAPAQPVDPPPWPLKSGGALPAAAACFPALLTPYPRSPILQ